MARSPSGAVLTETHRQRQMTLTAAATRDLLEMWSAIVNPFDFSTFDAFARLAARIIGLRRGESADIAAEYFAAFRRAEGVGGAAAPVLPPPVAPEEHTGLLRAAAIVGTANALRGGRDPREAARNGFVRTRGTATRLVLDGSRETLVRSVAADAKALGWQRVVDSDPCHFCAMQASRGAVFKNARTVRFSAHDHDQCTAEPLYEGSVPLAANERYAQLWAETTRGLAGREAQAAFRKAIEGQK